MVLFDAHFNVLTVQTVQTHFGRRDHPSPVRSPDADEVISGVQSSLATTAEEQFVHTHLRVHCFHSFLVVGEKHTG